MIGLTLCTASGTVRLSLLNACVLMRCSVAATSSVRPSWLATSGDSLADFSSK